MRGGGTTGPPDNCVVCREIGWVAGLVTVDCVDGVRVVDAPSFRGGIVAFDAVIVDD